MANKLQIKRSITTASPTGLANGELAYSANGGVLFIGSPSDGTTLAIGGLRNPGVLTANQSLVANATSAIDKVIVANLVPTQVYANGALGTAGQILTSGAAGNVYWSSPAAGVAGSNSQVQFNANGVLAGDDGFTYNGVSNTLTVQNIVVSGTATLNIDSISVGNSTVNTSLVPTLIQAANSTGTANLTPTSLTILGTIANTTGLFVGANVFANSSAFDVGNTIITSALLTLGGQVNANGGVGTAGQILTSGATGNVYWSTPASGVSGSNSQVQFNANGVLSGDDGFTYDGVSNTLTVSGNVSIGSTLLVGANVDLTTSALLIGNSTVNSTVNSTIVQVSSGSGTANLTPTTLVIGTSTVNSTAFAAGANVYANTSAILVGNSTVNAVLTQSSFDIDGTIAAGNTTLVGFINVSSTANVGGAVNLRSTLAVNGAVTVSNTAALGNTTITGFANVTSTIQGGSSLTIAGAASGITTLAAGNTTLTGFINVSSTANVGGAVNLRSTLTVNGAVTVPNTAALGNTTITGFANVTTTLQVGANVVLGTTTITANGGVGTAGQVLTSGATGNAYWSSVGTVTSVTGGNGLTGSVTTSGSLAVGAGNGITVNADDVAVNANSGLVANSTGVFVLANTGIIANSTGVFVNPVLSLTDLTLSGNLDVNGTLTTIDATNLSVTDSLISLARGQTTANTLDIGFYGTFGNSTVTQYSGLFRDSTDSKYRLFTGAIPEPTTTVDTANVNYAGATLVIQALEGANSTATIDLFIIDGGTF